MLGPRLSRVIAARWLPASRACSQQARPREWAVFRKIDRDGDGRATRAEIAEMCRKFDAIEHADVLNNILDPSGAGFVTFPSFCDNFRAVAMVRHAARLKQWHRCYGLGIAGNVAGHMEQAGEAGSPGAEPAASPTPAAVFTFYAPHPHSAGAPAAEVLERLARFPVTHAVIELPQLSGSSNVQVEPELGLYADVVYARGGDSVERLVPRRVAAFNDCSIRKLDGSTKLSEKKNWGFGSKGISLRSFPVDSFAPGGLLDRLVLVSYLRRGTETYQYSVSAPARSYLLFHEPLLAWIVDRVNSQGDVDKWEPIFPQLVASGYPTSMWIALGAGEYTDWGAQNYVQQGDETLVLLYDEEFFPGGLDGGLVAGLFKDGDSPDGMVALHQTFI